MTIIEANTSFGGCLDFTQDYILQGPEDQLQEIIIVAYGAALEAGLKPAQALAVLETWAASERSRLADHAVSSHCADDILASFRPAA